jgi:aspartyl-tRNA(Asn)/glutamyl-tRNA(Gln) amidotransferase subunit A
MAPVDILTVTETARRIRAGDLSPIAVVEACLAQIEKLELAIKAWVYVDAAGALETARTLDAEARAGRFRGPLHGVPVGLKDIFNVAGMVTTSGAGAFAHERPQTDAASVARLRQAGAVFIGKTTTTEFAYSDPAVTRNPWNREHTPGGSSSGSSAAVAVRMIPLALGSQTIGSTLRPAAYCGIVGLKPTYGRISTAGVTPLAWSLDHVGIFTRSVEDAAIALTVLASPESTDGCAAPVPTVDYMAALGRPVRSPRLGIPRALFREQAGAEVNAHLDAVASRFATAGASVEDVALPSSALAVHDAGQLVLRVDAATFHQARFAKHADEYRPGIRRLVEEGLTISGVEYVRAQQARRRFREEMGPILQRFDAFLMPVAPTTAPKGLDSTGDPVLCAPWSFGGLPSIALPSGVSGDGLPLAVQLVAGVFAEDRLLAVARWCEEILNFVGDPTVEIA